MSLKVHEKAAVGFNRANDSYERGRPEYPQSAVDFLVSTFQINPSSTVVDLGAGTGKFTKLFSLSGAKLIAVEPVEGMREKFKSLHNDIQVFEGSAERIPCADRSVDVVLAAQAFHWFNGPAALKEIHRVLKPQGKIGLIWNARDEAQAWVSELTRIIDPHEGDSPRYRSGKWRLAFDETALFTKLDVKHFPNAQVGTVETIVDRVGSISFISALPEDKRSQVLDQVRALIADHPDTRGSEEVRLPYRTDVYWCERV